MDNGKRGRRDERARNDRGGWRRGEITEQVVKHRRQMGERRQKPMGIQRGSEGKETGEGRQEKNERFKDRKQRRSGVSPCEKGGEETENKLCHGKQLPTERTASRGKDKRERERMAGGGDKREGCHILFDIRIRHWNTARLYNLFIYFFNSKFVWCEILPALMGIRRDGTHQRDRLTSLLHAVFSAMA